MSSKLLKILTFKEPLVGGGGGPDHLQGSRTFLHDEDTRMWVERKSGVCVEMKESLVSGGRGRDHLQGSRTFLHDEDTWMRVERKSGVCVEIKVILCAFLYVGSS
ncbi:hypothetical protein CDAR_45321 [Caerostris darwini]|uniref:Uncharacterized protein n=1 Tax=Caerostris darwini TaxID=1538125 RepID=A0AAV4SUZ4_9ARAC|nr:hypothetical protein CDAR_45321 [Caerostris darwini]